MQEKVIELKQCKHCDTSFEITDKDLEFYSKVSPIILWNKYTIPTPKLCPDCRQQRRMSWRNERHLYKRNCDASWKTIISMYSPDKSYKVYDQNIWHTDKWDAMNYWKQFDFSRWFFEQFDELMSVVPFSSMYAYFWENSEFCNCVNYQKNCYLTFASSRNENLLYASYTNDSNNCLDTFMTFNSENCYQVVDCKNCYQVYHSLNCVDCNSCFYSNNLVNCQNCFWCTNQVNKSYCIENIQYDKEEYFKKIESIFHNYTSKKPSFNKYITWNWNENVSWDYIRNSKNTHSCYDVNNLEDCKYLAWFHDSKSCYDAYSWWQQSELCYEWVAIWDHCNNLAFCSNVDLSSSFILYSIHCASSSNLFWCIWLRNKSYCILNKQYTKEEYEKLVPKIIEQMQKTWEWWEFFPSNISPFWYNETVAMEYFSIPYPSPLLWEEREQAIEIVIHPSPIKKKELRMRFNWSTYESPLPNVEKIIKADHLPENIADIPDDILNWAIECEITKKPFRIIKPELDFYRKHNLPIPKKHPDQRHADRMKLRNPRKLYDRKCDNCGVDMKTTYSPERPEKVYCEDCYNKEVY